jgi:hypothetical protein
LGTLEGHWKGPQKFIFNVMKNIKKDIMGVKNIGVLVGENEISYFKINGNENNFMGNLHDHGLSILIENLSLKSFI